jgi:hypothetical protein
MIAHRLTAGLGAQPAACVRQRQSSAADASARFAGLVRTHKSAIRRHFAALWARRGCSRDSPYAPCTAEGREIDSAPWRQAACTATQELSRMCPEALAHHGPSVVPSSRTDLQVRAL